MSGVSPIIRRPALFILGGMLAACSHLRPESDGVPSHATGAKRSARAEPAMLAAAMPDPFEPVNRGVWELNRGLLAGVLQPTGRVYRTMVPTPVRGSIRDFTRNATYPGRCLNHILQGRWAGAGDESLRFLCNTTVGLGGLLDVATRWKIPQSEADFAQTFGGWGWKPRTYLMLPLLGPSDGCHAVGWAADEAASPWNYVKYCQPVPYAAYYNQQSGHTEEEMRMIRAEADPYSTLKYVWTYSSSDSSPDHPPEQSARRAPDPATLQTLGVARIACHNPDFPGLGREMSAPLPATGRAVRFNCWLQPGRAPLVYVAPGVGSHRLSMTALSVAECLYQQGFSVVTTTSVFHPEFMQEAASVALPAYAPVDCHDLLAALTAIDRVLEQKRPGLAGDRALVGLSLGGFQTLYLAAHAPRQEAGLLRFDRYVAIEAPVSLGYGITCIDRFNEASRAWPAAERQDLASHALHKAAMLEDPAAASSAGLAFDGIESKFLIGLTFQLTLRDAIFSSQLAHNLGVLHTPLSRWRREPCYQEIAGYTYRDYFLRFVVPYYRQRGIGADEISRQANLMTCETSLRAQSKVRVIANRNDFLLTGADLAWLHRTFGGSRLKLFPDGGHLGNLASAPVQQAILSSLSGLK